MQTLQLNRPWRLPSFVRIQFLGLAASMAMLVLGAPSLRSQDVAETGCREHLETLGAAYRMFLRMNEGKPPARMSDFYTQGIVIDFDTFVCPASSNRISEAKALDERSSYEVTTALGDKLPMLLFKEKHGHHSGHGLSFYSDRTFKKNPAPPPPNNPSGANPPPAVVQTNPPAVTNRVAGIATNVISLPGIPGDQRTNVPPAVITAADVTAAQALASAGRNAEAVAAFDRILLADPQNKTALWGRGFSRLWTADTKGALADLRQLAASDADNLEVRRLRALLELTIGDATFARSEADALLRLQSNNPQMHLLHGQAALKNNDTDTARRSLAQAFSMDPSLSTSLYQQANQFLAARVPSVAYLQFSTVLWMDPRSQGAYYGLGMSASQLGYKEQAIQALESYLRVDATSAHAETARNEIRKLRQP